MPVGLFPGDFTPTFSGHETFALRSTWLKKAYDVLLVYPDLFARDDAIVRLGVGKNMVQSIRFWGRVCGVFQRSAQGDHYGATNLGHCWLNSLDGWDPYFVSPASWWLLHWNVASNPEAAFTWFYVFNLLRGGEFTIANLTAQLQSFTSDQGWRIPSDSTLERDIDCMIRCYARPTIKQIAAGAEDSLLCPLSELGLLDTLPGERIYHTLSGAHPTLPDDLVAYAIHSMMVRQQRRTIAFSDLAYAPRSPGRVFRLDEDSLLSRLHKLTSITGGDAYYTDQAGIRQVAWTGAMGDDTAMALLQRMFEREVRDV
nr:DUF4007 family protein [Herpetosiphon giganteus]